MEYFKVIIRTFTFSSLALFLSASPAWANQPPGPMLMLAETLTFLLLVSCSLIGGYYAFTPQSSRWGRFGKILMALLIIFLSGAHEGYAAIVTMVLTGIALYRGCTMCFWGIQRLRDRPESLQNAVPWRLFLASLVMIPAALFFLGMAFAFQSSFIGTGQYTEERRMERFKDFVAYQMAYARLAEQETGGIRFHRPSKQEPYPRRFKREFSAERDFRLQLEFDDTNGRFTASLPALLPFFPYNLLTSVPAYYGDETGAIRMIRVQYIQEFPADAPVVLRISPEDIEKMKQEILSERTAAKKK